MLYLLRLVNAQSTNRNKLLSICHETNIRTKSWCPLQRTSYKSCVSNGSELLNISKILLNFKSRLLCWKKQLMIIKKTYHLQKYITYFPCCHKMWKLKVVILKRKFVCSVQIYPHKTDITRKSRMFFWQDARTQIGSINDAWLRGLKQKLLSLMRIYK